jgi:hypothetical protein
MSDPNYECEILEEKLKIQTPPAWNEYSTNYLYGFILTISVMFFYYKTKDSYFFYDGSNKRGITIGIGLMFLFIMVLGGAGVGIKHTEMVALTAKKKKRNVDSDKKKLWADIILYSYMIIIGINWIVAQKIGKRSIPT